MKLQKSFFLSSRILVYPQVVNLVSNDVRRFDESMPYWTFLWCGPLELACVALMISLELGAAAAFAGIGTLLALIPLQVRLTTHHCDTNHDD